MTNTDGVARPRRATEGKSAVRFRDAGAAPARHPEDRTGVVAPPVVIGGPGSAGSRRSLGGDAFDGAIPPRPWATFRSSPRSVWLIVLVHGLMLLSWSVLAPTYHAPDEPNHVDAAVRLYNGLGWPAPATNVYMTPDGLSSWVASPYSRADQPLVLNPSTQHQSDAVPRDQRVPWDQLRTHYPPPKRNPQQTQQMVQHPPLYYAMGAALLHVLPDATHWRWDSWVGVMRLLSIALSLALPLLCWAGAMAFTRDPSSALVAALTPLAIPQMSHILSVGNNDSAVTLFASLAIFGMVCVLRGDRSRSTAVFLGVSTGLALFSKSLAVALIPMIVAAYLLGERTPDARMPDVRTAGRADGRRGVALLTSPALLTLVVAFVLGGWWYAFQYLRTGHVQPGVPGLPGGFRVDGRLQFLDNAWRLLLQRFWGSIGWYEVDLRFRYVVLATLVVLVGIVVAVVRTRTMRSRAALILLLWPVIAVTGFVMLNSYGFYRHYGRVLGVQGRYLFLGWVGVAVVLAAAVAAMRPALRRRAPLVVAALAAVMQILMVHRVLHVWWIPPGEGLRQAWGAITAFAIWPPMVVRIIAVSTTLAVLATVGTLVVDARLLSRRRGIRPGASGVA